MMNKELKDFVKDMIEEVSALGAKMYKEVDAIWDRNYNSLVDLVVDESCDDEESCDEKKTHDMMADLRIMFYNGAEDHSFTCEGCRATFYGKPFKIESRKFCRECRDTARDKYSDED